MQLPSYNATFAACFEIMQRLDSYPALDESRWSELEADEESQD